MGTKSLPFFFLFFFSCGWHRIEQFRTHGMQTSKQWIYLIRTMGSSEQDNCVIWLWSRNSNTKNQNKSFPYKLLTLGFCHSRGKLNINTWACLKAGKVCVAHGSKVTVTSSFAPLLLSCGETASWWKETAWRNNRDAPHIVIRKQREKGEEGLS